MTRFLYVTGMSSSGTTLLSFLLNTHPDIFTVSHTTGFAFREDEDSRCSCGAALPDCPFFSRMARVFQEKGLPFAFNNFGTHYCFFFNERVNQWFTESLPLITSSGLEKTRDALFRALPGFGTVLRRIDRANRVFVSQALSYSGAKVFADTSQIPHRLRQLRRIPDFDISVIHLVRDPRGVAASHLRRNGVEPVEAVRHWMREETVIFKVIEDFPEQMTVHYEELCEDADGAVERIYRFLRLNPHPLPKDFKQVEHHIIGNDMRGKAANISKDERWKTELSRADIEKIQEVLRSFIGRKPTHPLTHILRRYLDSA